MAGPALLAALVAARDALQRTKHASARRAYEYINKWLLSVARLALRRVAVSGPIVVGDATTDAMWAALVAARGGEKQAGRRAAEVAARFYRLLTGSAKGILPLVDREAVANALRALGDKLHPKAGGFGGGGMLLLLLVLAMSKRR